MAKTIELEIPLVRLAGTTEKDEVEQELFGQKIGLLARIFGCFHTNMSRPFSKESVGYRVCLDCGAARRFDTESLETFGGYYFPPAKKVNE